MLKKRTQTSLLVLLGLASTSLMAHSSDNFRGFYAGLEVGGLQTDARMNATTYVDYENAGAVLPGAPLSSALASFQEGKEYKNTVVGAFNLGYGDFVGDIFHLAGEVFVNVASRRGNISPSGADLQLNDLEGDALTNSTSAKLRSWEVGVDVLPGIQFSDNSLVYARVGAAFNKMTLESNSVFSVTEDVTTPGAQIQSAFYNSADKTRAGLRLGLGVEQAVCPNLSVTADYIYTYYGDIDTAGVADVVSITNDGSGPPPVAVDTNNANGFVNAASARLATQTLMVGAKYYFH